MVHEQAALRFTVPGADGGFFVPVLLVVGMESEDSEGRRLVRVVAPQEFQRMFVPYVPAANVFDPYGGKLWFEREGGAQ